MEDAGRQILGCVLLPIIDSGQAAIVVQKWAVSPLRKRERLFQELAKLLFLRVRRREILSGLRTASDGFAQYEFEQDALFSVGG